MSKTTKYLTLYSIASTFVAILMTYNVVQLLETTTVMVEPNECISLEDQIRGMSTDDTNKIMIILAETLTANYKEETREQVEKEHQDYANRLALGHMNNVVGVLVKSVGSMPTSTLSHNE